MPTVPSALRRTALGFVLAGLHSISVVWAWWQVVAHPGLLSGFHWLPVAMIDFPLTLAVEQSGAAALLGGGPTSVGLTYLIGGWAYWLLVGAAAQAACRWFLRRAG